MSAHPPLPPFGRETANRGFGSQGRLEFARSRGVSPLAYWPGSRWRSRLIKETWPIIKRQPARLSKRHRVSRRVQYC
jgi:hypothetical protein